MEPRQPQKVPEKEIRKLTAPSNFIHAIIEEHNKTGRFGGRVEGVLARLQLGMGDSRS